ncbi:LysR substrate-binding domain-containing protein [Hydrogenophaga palleronii]|uniref:LysR substrate-binding domain-containing protein n=1 Tax=Hydrogenophaga palleronii TaxID=65655 RepID=UPI0008265317|nr:LysR substrate-binding domain-containing protein [Hydrogenophaga palleronii]
MPFRNVKIPLGALPRSQMLRLDLLPCFDAAARTLSFTLAAEELHLTQSAVSRQIQLLEESLGTPLFERHHRALVLTDAGEVMQRATRDALERLRDASARVRPGPRLRQVAMTCTHGFASLWLIPRLARFTASHPQVDVRISASMEIMDLERHRLDMAVRFVPSSIGRGQALFEETVQPLCAPSLLRDKTTPLRQPADLAHHTLLTVEKPTGPALTTDWEPWFQVMGLPDMRMKNTMQFTQYADAVAAAVAGQGVVIGRLPLLQSLVDRKQLVAPFRSGGAATRRGYYVEMAAHAHDNPDALDFANWLRAEAERG